MRITLRIFCRSDQLQQEQDLDGVCRLVVPAFTLSGMRPGALCYATACDRLVKDLPTPRDPPWVVPRRTSLPRHLRFALRMPAAWIRPVGLWATAPRGLPWGTSTHSTPRARTTFVYPVPVERAWPRVFGFERKWVASGTLLQPATPVRSQCSPPMREGSPPVGRPAWAGAAGAPIQWNRPHS